MARDRRSITLPGRPGLYKPSELDRCEYCNHLLERRALGAHVREVCRVAKKERELRNTLLDKEN